jgi:hypothetical protein
MKIVRSFVSAAFLAGAATAYAQGAAKPEKKPAAPGAGAPAAQPAPPAEPPKMEMPTPAPEIAEAFKKMKGTWKCTGHGFDPMQGRDRPWAGQVTFKLDLGGFWIVMTGKEKQSKDAPHPMLWTEYRTYDAKQKKWVAAGVDNMGMIQHATGTSDGTTIKWEGKGSGGGMTMHMRGTETAVSPRETTVKFEMSMDGRNWMLGFEASCKK